MVVFRLTLRQSVLVHRISLYCLSDLPADSSHFGQQSIGPSVKYFVYIYKSSLPFPDGLFSFELSQHGRIIFLFELVLIETHCDFYHALFQGS